MDLLKRPRVLVGMVHLAPLPGSPGFGGAMEAVHRAARRDAGVLVEEGFDALLVENYGDLPFYPDNVPSATIAAMSVVLEHLRRDLPGIPLGVNVLRNDAGAALAIAAAVGAAFIRVNVHCGAAITDQGILQGRAHETLRLRAALAPGTAILADAAVKHGRGFTPGPLAEEVLDLVERGLADGVLVTGSRTGMAASLEKVREAVEAAGRVPVWVASGVAADNATEYLEAGARGLIVGTSIKRGGHAEAAVDRLRARELARRVRAFRDAGASEGKSVTGKPVTGKPAAGRARTRS
jgi:hypothetical protein